jgi:RNA polymerase sigma-70 factor (ECF subfamily)
MAGANQEILTIYRGFFDRIFRYCAYRLFSENLAEDATSAVFLQLVSAWPRLTGKSREQIQSWLYGTANNVIISFLRDGRRLRAIKSVLADQSSDRRPRGTVGADRLDWVRLYDAISRLGPNHQAMVVLHYFEELSVSEVGDVLGKKESTVRVELWRAVQKLRRELKANFGEGYATTH